MSGATRKGLKKIGLRCYLVSGPRKNMIIERDRPWRFFAYPEGLPPYRGDFFNTKFRRLGDARRYAEEQAGCFT